MYNLAIRKGTSPPLIARGSKSSNENLLPRRGSNPGPAEPEAHMLPEVRIFVTGDKRLPEQAP